MGNKTLEQIKMEVYHTPISCPACNGKHTYQQVKDAGYACPKTKKELSVYSELGAESQHFELKKPSSRA